MKDRGARIALLSGLALWGMGCGTPPQERFYTLGEYTLGEYTRGEHTRGAAAPLEAIPGGAGYSVAIGPVTVPEGVDRPQMVVRASGHRVEVSELHRWAEPLKSEIPRVLAAHLRRELRTEQIATTDQGAGRAADYRIRVDVQRFESYLGKGVVVETLWSVHAAEAGSRTGRSAVHEPAEGADHEALARAYGRALAKIAHDLAAALRSLRARGP